MVVLFIAFHGVILNLMDGKLQAKNVSSVLNYLFYRIGNKCAEQYSLILLYIRGFRLRYFSVEQCFFFFSISTHFFARNHLLLSCESYLKETGLK